MMMTCGLDSNSVGVMQVADRRPLYPVIDHQAQLNCPRAHPCSWNRECLPTQERTKNPECGYLKIETVLLFLTDFRMNCSSFRSQILPTERQKFVNIGGCSSDFCNFSHIFFHWTNFSNTSSAKGGCCVLRQVFSFYNNISSNFSFHVFQSCQILRPVCITFTLFPQSQFSVSTLSIYVKAARSALQRPQNINLLQKFPERCNTSHFKLHFTTFLSKYTMRFSKRY